MFRAFSLVRAISYRSYSSAFYALLGFWFSSACASLGREPGVGSSFPCLTLTRPLDNTNRVHQYLNLDNQFLGSQCHHQIESRFGIGSPFLTLLLLYLTCTLGHGTDSKCTITNHRLRKEGHDYTNHHCTHLHLSFIHHSSFESCFSCLSSQHGAQRIARDTPGTTMNIRSILGPGNLTIFRLFVCLSVFLFSSSITIRD
ncbi:hypothetical protein BD289DRAFT_441905, partial [Coniella lustricola]